MASSNPLKQVLDIRREELPQALLMSSYFFLVITSFWILKPLKKGLFVQYYEESGFELLGWMLTAAPLSTPKILAVFSVTACNAASLSIP